MYSTTKFKRLFLLPDGGLEASTVTLKCNRLYTVPDAVFCAGKVPKTECVNVQYVTVDLKKVKYNVSLRYREQNLMVDLKKAHYHLSVKYCAQ